MSDRDIDAEAREYVRERLRLMDDRYVDRYPRWTVHDHVAVSLVLQQASQSARCNALAAALESILKVYGEIMSEELEDMAEAALEAAKVQP